MQASARRPISAVNFLSQFSKSFYLLRFFPTSYNRWSLSDNKSTQISRTFLSIPADFTKAVIRIVSFLSLISSSSSLISMFWGLFQGASNTIAITVTFMFHIFYQYSGEVQDKTANLRDDKFFWVFFSY